ncbi:MAG: SDR family oxidoreductase [Pseudomonadota bacterium]
MSNSPTAFITGASRGIGAESAVALARAGYNVAITARTMSEGQSQDYVAGNMPLPGSLEATAAAVRAHGREALCLQADVLQPDSIQAAADHALQHFGQIDFLFNNAIYQGEGNLTRTLDLERQHLDAMYQGNVYTPLALVQAFLPGMLEQGQGTILNMLSHTAFHNPPAAADSGGWNFVYPSSKAALGRMAGALRVEHPDSGLRVFNIEPGTVITEVMRSAGIDENTLAQFKTCTPQSIAAVVAWLAQNEPQEEWQPDELLRAPSIAKQLNLLGVASLLNN